MSSAKRSVPGADAGGCLQALERSEKSASSCTALAEKLAGRKMLREGRSERKRTEMLRSNCQPRPKEAREGATANRKP